MRRGIGLALLLVPLAGLPSRAAGADPPAKPGAPPAAAAGALTPEERDGIQKALAANGTAAALRSAEIQGDVLTLRFQHASPTSEAELDQAIGADVVPAAKAGMNGVPRAMKVRLDFLACWRDRLGNVAARTYRAYSMDRALFEKIHFENLERDEALDLFAKASPTYAAEGLKLWWKEACTEVAPEPTAPPDRPSPAVGTPPAHKTTPAIADGLRWLAAHQSADGGWEADQFARWCNGKEVEPPAGDVGGGKAQYGIGVSRLALLAFLRAGWTSADTDDVGRALAGGLRHFVSVQTEDGCFGPQASGHWLYGHAIATLAMIEAYATSRDARWLRPAQQGAAYLEAARNPNAAWRYGIRPGDNDTSMTGWAGQVFYRARDVDAREKAAGRGVPFAFSLAVFDGIHAWLDQMTDPKTGRVGYQLRGSGPARPTDLVDKFPQEKSEAMTAIALLLRLLRSPDTKDKTLQAEAAACAALTPVWNTLDGSIDMYFWHYATAALKRYGGAAWRQWKAAMKSAAESAQVRTGDVCGLRGSWNPVDPWGADGGRVYSTALILLCLEVCAE